MYMLTDGRSAAVSAACVPSHPVGQSIQEAGGVGGGHPPGHPCHTQPLCSLGAGQPIPRRYVWPLLVGPFCVGSNKIDLLSQSTQSPKGKSWPRAILRIDSQSGPGKETGKLLCLDSSSALRLQATHSSQSINRSTFPVGLIRAVNILIHIHMRSPMIVACVLASLLLQKPDG